MSFLISLYRIEKIAGYYSVKKAQAILRTAQEANVNLTRPEGETVRLIFNEDGPMKTFHVRHEGDTVHIRQGFTRHFQLSLAEPGFKSWNLLWPTLRQRVEIGQIMGQLYQDAKAKFQREGDIVRLERLLNVEKRLNSPPFRKGTKRN